MANSLMVRSKLKLHGIRARMSGSHLAISSQDTCTDGLPWRL